MPQLTPQDIASYLYCPLAYKEGRTAKPLTFFEASVREAFIEGERSAVLKGPAAAGRGVKMKRAQELTLKAVTKFTDYCKYDISDYSYPTAGVQAGLSVPIGRHTLIATADLVKINLNLREKTTVLVNFTNIELDQRAAIFDPVAKATAYAFYRGKGEAVTHIYVNINKDLEKLSMVTSTFYKKDMEGIRKMLYHVEQGISSGTFHPNPYLCKECNRCKIFK
ncbi:MAG: hypothetical protein ACXABY_36175 [Candidatus Thorarchaeota archaeon]|jgi:hypothetical protein